MENYQKNIRNFCIIAHIDHGKSTLADRLLELTGTIEKRKMREQYLDQMELERERGITIKMQPVRMHYTPNATPYILNLIDTPGHVDFTYEVSRALAAVEGAILLVDATKGIQAQTLSNLHLAQSQKFVIIPVVNKIDLANARVKETKEEMARLLSCAFEDILEISSKTGAGVERVLTRIVEKIPFPPISLENHGIARALVFDSKFDPFKGVVAHVRVFEGEIRPHEKIMLLNRGIEAEVLELGIFKPELSPQVILREGEIGYIATGIKEAEKVRVGETIAKGSVAPLVGYKEPSHMVFASFYPEDADEYNDLTDAFKQLKLQDASIMFENEYSSAFGRGYRCGFLGLLHMEIISERLKREFGLLLVITSPTVLYKLKKQDGSESAVYTPRDLPKERMYRMSEPWARLEIITPRGYLGKVMELLREVRGEFGETNSLGEDRLVVVYRAPLQEIITGFFDKLKSASSGYASMSYALENWREADLDEMEILVAGEKAESLSQIVFALEASRIGRKVVEKLKEALPQRNFAVALQARFRGKIIAREDLKALRKDVTAKLYGGDYTRKRKLLEKQKKGKKKMRAIGKVAIPADVFLKLLRR